MEGITKLRRLRRSSWNSGERSSASPSTGAVVPCPTPLLSLRQGVGGVVPALRGCEHDTGRYLRLRLRLPARRTRGRPRRARARPPAPAARRPPPSPPRPPACAARAAPARRATAPRPAGLPRGRVAARPAAEEEIESISIQKHCTTGSGPPKGRIWRTPVMMPSTPMKRVSSPTRIAFSETKTIASARASAPQGARAAGRTARARWS